MDMTQEHGSVKELFLSYKKLENTEKAKDSSLDEFLAARGSPFEHVALMFDLVHLPDVEWVRSVVGMSPFPCRRMSQLIVSCVSVR